MSDFIKYGYRWTGMAKESTAKITTSSLAEIERENHKKKGEKKKRKLLDFEDWYAIAKKYYEEHGDLLVPHSYEDGEGHKLGRWIERLRAFYNGNPKVQMAITQTGIEMLNKIGMVWKLEDRFTWPEWYLQCRLYYAANGDLLVPKAYKNEKYALGNWIGEQRKKYKKGTLKEEQIEALEKCGMVWEVIDRDVWEKRYNDAYAYFKVHGNLDVPSNVITAGNVYLRDWLIAQKSLYREENCEADLDWERHDLLDDIGMDWEKQKSGRAVYSYAYRAQKYYEEHGNLNVPEGYRDMMGVDLYEWVKRQWRLYHRPGAEKSKAYKSKKKELTKLGFDWSCDGHWDWDPKEAAWLKNYNSIKAYVDEYEKLPVGAAAFQLPSEANSEFWIDGQRAAMRNGLMNEDKQKMLADIGIVYGQMESEWQESYSFVKEYFQQNKRLPLGVNSQVMSNGNQSGPWISAQRMKMKDNALSTEKVKMLKEIGIEYGQVENSWQANYNAVKAYVLEYHYLPVRDASITLPSGVQSRTWIINQKKNIKTGNITDDRKRLLIEIGISSSEDIPNTQKREHKAIKEAEQTKQQQSRKRPQSSMEDWQECYEFIKQYHDRNGILPVEKKSEPLPNGVQTQSWIKQQRKLLKGNELPSDKVELLSNIGIVGNVMEQNWMRNYECIKAYVEEHQKLPVNKNSIKLPDGGQSTQWIANRRTQMHNNTMPVDKVKLLADIGIVYGSVAKKWDDNYNAVKAYFDEHGVLPENKKSIILPSGTQSRWWIRNQKLALHHGQLDEEKAKLLIAIGII